MMELERIEKLLFETREIQARTQAVHERTVVLQERVERDMRIMERIDAAVAWLLAPENIRYIQPLREVLGGQVGPFVDAVETIQREVAARDLACN